MFRAEISRKILSMLPWEDVDEVLEKIKIEAAKQKAEKSSDGEEDTGGGY